MASVEFDEELFFEHTLRRGIVCYHDRYCRLQWFGLGGCDCHYPEMFADERVRRTGIEAWMVMMAVVYYGIRCQYTSRAGDRCRALVWPVPEHGHWGRVGNVKWTERVDVAAA
jgi:hypothetical protein